ncbi:chromosome partitioning protein [Pseudonocardia sp.]|uniref:chromosome partitioning protein n=1 Tax=Pseudonocardia sp. TaxID=60912 RepID=UPI0026146672|nr:chromosome partitioning protein [Pseudonocardia sp.]
MSAVLVAVASVKGSPGVTTLCVALAACWPDPAGVVVVEADPAGGDVAMRFGLAQSPGLFSLAAATRGGVTPLGSRVENAQLLWRHAQVLPGDVPVVASPPDAGRARGALAVLASPEPAGRLAPGPLLAAAEHPGAVLVADCGRVEPESPAMPLLRSADVLVLLSGAHADDLAHLARRVPEIGAWSRRPVLLLADRDAHRGHSIAAVARELGVAPLARVPFDPRGAAVLSGRRSTLRWHHSGPGRSLLGQSAREIAELLAPRGPDPSAGRRSDRAGRRRTARSANGSNGPDVAGRAS